MSNYTPKSSGNVTDFFSGSSTETHKKTVGNWKSLAIINDGQDNLTITVNNVTITVAGSEQFDDNFAEFNSMAVTTTVAYRLVCRE